MRAKWRVPFSLLALVAMFATMLPQTLWACPMTGRVDSPARVCLGVMPLVKGEMPCAHRGGKCCKPLSIPPTPNDDQHQSLAAAGVVEKSAPVFALLPPTQDAHPVVFAAPFGLRAEEERLSLVSFGEYPPSYWTEHRPITCAGRAPPVF